MICHSSKNYCFQLVATRKSITISSPSYHHQFRCIWLILVSCMLLFVRSNSNCIFRVSCVVQAMSSKVPIATTMRGSSTGGSGSNNNQPKKGKLIFHWFRHGDLRLQDNPALAHTCKLAATAAAGSNVVVLPIFCFDDENFFGNTVRTTTSDDDNLKCGPKRAKFIMECVSNLQSNLRQSYDCNLLVARGSPATVFSTIIQRIKESSSIDYEYTVVCQDEVVKEEKDACKSVLSAIKKTVGKAKLYSIWGSTMYELKDLPYDHTDRLQDMPDVFTPFRNTVEKKCVIPRAIAAPSKSEIMKLPAKDTMEFKVLAQIMALYNKVPTLQELGYTDEQVQFANQYDPRGVMEFKGGETAGLQRIQDYIWTLDCLKDYFDTRNGMVGPNYSTKFSPWLAHGCVSPRTIVMECHKYEKQRVQNKSTYWVVFELLWRDYCKFFAYKYGDAIFFAGGTAGKKVTWTNYGKSIEAWKAGTTGYPLVDANMRELLATGFMSNRGRQNVASFLAIDLAQDWRIGGDYFESHLIDYDVYSNWVNWCSAAGMTGGRLNRFNIAKQSKDYDQHGDYVRRWIPELKNVPNEFVHEPWKMTSFQQTECNVRLGVEYPNPIVPPNAWKGDGPNSGGGKSGGSTNNARGNKQQRQRKPNQNPNNRGQKYEMKSVKTGGYQVE